MADIRHWFMLALAKFFFCLFVYQVVDDGLGETSTWLWLAAAGLMIAAVVLEVVERRGGDRDGT